MRSWKRKANPEQEEPDGPASSAPGGAHRGETLDETLNPADHFNDETDVGKDPDVSGPREDESIVGNHDPGQDDPPPRHRAP